MAEAVLFTVANKILDTLTTSAIDAVKSSWGAKDDLRMLEQDIGVIRDVLLDAEQRQNETEVKRWLVTLKDVIYDADDLVNEIAVEGRMRQLMRGDKLFKRVRFFLSSSNPLVLNFKLAGKVKDIRARLDVIKSTMGAFKFALHRAEEQALANVGDRQTYYFVNAEDIIGREGDEKEIMGMLLGSETQDSPSVVPIVGIGGLGKTALAQVVYSREMVGKHFEVRMWVCVSEDFDEKLIVKNIARTLSDESVDGVVFDKLLDRIQRAIGSKRYLLVLDDVWNEDSEKWLRLKSLLPSGGKGSKIIVTTRSKIVANIMGTVSSHELEGLSEVDSWSLFKTVAFKTRQMEDDPEFKNIGRAILKKCANVPLAIRTVGSLLRTKDTAREWSSINEEMLWEMKQELNHIMPVLRISYNHLPLHLKHCFAFCSLFPKDYSLSKEWLVHHWIAAGFIIPSNRNQSLEDAGEDCFFLLLRRCFFQDVDRDVSGRIISCKMHDLIHDLAQLVAGKEIINVENSDTRGLHDGIRYVNFDGLRYTTWTLPEPLLGAKSLRVFSITRRNSLKVPESTCDTLFTQFKYLRMLDLHSIDLREVPSSIGELRLLAFLDLSWNERIKSLPSSFTKLLNLQILDISKCRALQRLPRDFRKMVSLTYLDIRECDSLTSMPQLPLLLQALSHLRFRKASIDTRRSWWNETICVMTLTGVHLEDKHGAAPRLQVRLDHDVLDRSQKLPTSIEALEFIYFQEERIPSCGMDEFPCSLSNLAMIKFAHCQSFQNLPPFGRLPALKILVLQHMEELEYIENGNNEDSSSATAIFFPSLEELELLDLPNLKGWSREVACLVDDQQNHHLLPSFPLLSRLRISDCPNLTSLPLVSKLKNPHLNNVNEILSQTLMKRIEH